MRPTRPVIALDAPHGKALEALAAVGSRVDATEAQLVALRSQRAALLNKHTQKAADALEAGGTVPAPQDTRKLDAEIETLEATHRELARRRRTQADAEISARLRGLEGAVKGEEKRHAAILKSVSDHEQAILQCRADAEGSRLRQAELAEQLAEAQRLTGDGRVCCLYGTLDEIAVAIEDPTNQVDRIEARRHLARWRAGDPQLNTQSINGVNYFQERKRVVGKVVIYYRRANGQILAAVPLEWRDTESPVWSFDINGVEGHLLNLEQYVRIEEFQNREATDV